MNKTAYVALGSNLQDPLNQIKLAIKALSSLPSTQLVESSNLYHSSPMGPIEQPDYINAAVRLNTKLSPFDLFEHLQAIEKRQMRFKSVCWGPRTIDLDLIFFENYKLNTSSLIIPHPGVYERNFVLVPLRDLDQDMILPNGYSIQDWIDQLESTVQLVRIETYEQI